jgi:hypothetical protein
MHAFSANKVLKSNKQKKPACGLVLCGWNKVGNTM